MAEDFYTDEFDLTPEKEPEKEKPVIQIPERKGPDTPIMDVLFGPKGVELAGDSFLTTGKAARRIAERVAGVKEEDLTPLGDVDPFTAFVGGVVDGTVKIPYGVASLTAEIMDALGEDNIPVDQGKVAQLEKYFSNTVFGKIQQGSEDIIKDSAVGKLTSALTQLYGYGRVGAAGAVKVGDKALQIYNKFSNAAKLNKVARASNNTTKAIMRAKEMNKLTGVPKHAAVILGGATGTAMVADVEDIGTWGDVLGGPSALDRDQRSTSDEDATRRLWNRFKFGTEGAVVSVPIAYGINKVAKKIAQHGRELKFSDKKIDRLINKYMVEPFRPAGKKEQYLFEGIKKVEGKISAGQVTATDLIKDIDQTLYNVAKQSGLSTGNKNWKRIIGRLDELLTSSDDVIQGGKVVFKGFEPKQLNQFYNFLDEVGISKPQGRTLVEEMIKVREQFNVFKNSLFQGGNINAANKEFSQIMSERMKNIFNSEYKIMEGKSIFPWLNYKPTDAVINDVKGVFQRYAKENKINLTETDLDTIIEDIYKNIRFNDLTKTPEFPLTVLSVLDDKATQLINIADNIKGGAFKPTTLIQSEKDLRAFQRFYGQKRDLRNTIINTINDLGTLAAKDEFYNGVLQKSKELIDKGQRATIYPTRLEALRNLPSQEIITNPTGLQIKSPLGESIYTNPLNGQFTSKELKDALQFSEKILFDKLSKEVLYQHLVLIPKGITQISKTILGPFTHTRNFLTSAQFSLGTGNLFKNPVDIVRNFKQAFNTVQPQLLYRNLPKDQALYKFLLEEQVTSSSATARDIAGLLDDIGRGGDVYMRFFGKFGRGMKKLYEKAGDLYVAEDDIFKVFNFLGENDSYTKAYQNAFKKGLIKKMPSELQIMKEAANIVRNTVPNYSYVGEFGQAVRRLPFGNFISFPIEVTRTAANIMQLGLKEARNPILKDIGYRRLAGFATATATAPVVASAVVGGLYGVTSAMISAAREFVPSFSESSTLFVIRDKDGSLKYIDGSGFMVYDTVVNPMQSVIAGVNSENVFDSNAPLTQGVLKGLAKGLERFVRPYVDESIWTNVLTNLLIRDGVTADGRKLWNPDAPWGEKIGKAAKYALIEVAPLSYKQLDRLRLAAQELPGPRGEKYELDDELAGFWGLRPIKLDPIKGLNYKINEFKEGLRNTRSLFTGEILRGGSITGEDIISRFYIANQQRFKEFKTLKRKIDAAEILEAKKQDLVQLFSKRAELKNYAAVKRDRFIPFGITATTLVEAKRQEEDIRAKFEDLSIPAGIDRETLRAIQKMTQDMYRINLEEDFNKQIKLEDYLPKQQSSLPGASGERQVTQVPPLPPQPMPNQQVISPPPVQVSQLNQGLTPAESSYLSEDEKQMRLRQRGLS
jgi:hypothetical protein